MRRPEPWSRRRALAGLLAGAVGPVLVGSTARAAPAPEPGAWSGYAGPPVDLSLHNATLIDHRGRVTPGAGLRMEGGRIVELGTSVRSGEDLGGAWLCPGLVDAGALLGLFEVDLEAGTHDDSESSAAVSPDARVVDAYNPLSELIPVTRRNGIAHVLVQPSPGRLVSGQAALFRLAGRTVEEATVQAPVGLCVNLGGAGKGGEGGPGSRMGIAMRLRELLSAPTPTPEAPRGRKARAARDPAAEDPAPADRVWQRVVDRELKVLFHAERADDLLMAVALAREFDLDAVLVGGAEAWLVAPELARAGIPLLLGPTTVQPSSFEHPHARDDNAALLHAAAIPFALRTGAAHTSRDLPVMAGLAAAHGLPREAAVHAMSAAAGEILGLPGLGCLEPGGPATFFQVDGDPLQPRYAVRRMWLDGRPLSLESRQTRLFRQFEVLQ